MSHRITLGILIAGAMTCAPYTLSGQWLNYPDARTPRTKDGRPNLTAPAPRINGKPDLSGVWQAQRAPLEEYARVLGQDTVNLQVDIQLGSVQTGSVFWGMKPEDAPLTPEGTAILKQHMGLVGPPVTGCLPVGMPGILVIYAFKIVQTSQEIVILPEHADPPRQIYLDGRGLPKNPDPTWNGYSVGKWQGDTLVVDTIGLNDKPWLDYAGHPRSERMHITERYRRRDFGHIDLEMTFEDPKYYTRPFSFKTVLNLIPDSDVLEYVCAENERDGVHLPK
jgi:hypothetical protein